MADRKHSASRTVSGRASDTWSCKCLTNEWSTPIYLSRLGWLGACRRLASACPCTSAGKPSPWRPLSACQSAHSVRSDLHKEIATSAALFHPCCRKHLRQFDLCVQHHNHAGSATGAGFMAMNSCMHATAKHCDIEHRPKECEKALVTSQVQRLPAPISHLNSSMLLSALYSRSLATNFAGSQYPTLGSCSPASAMLRTLFTVRLATIALPARHPQPSVPHDFQFSPDAEVAAISDLLSPKYLDRLHA